MPTAMWDEHDVFPSNHNNELMVLLLLWLLLSTLIMRERTKMSLTMRSTNHLLAVHTPTMATLAHHRALRFVMTIMCLS
jgi:hypothetical protein